MDVTDMHLQCDKDEDGQLKKQKQTTSHRYIGVSSSFFFRKRLTRQVTSHKHRTRNYKRIALRVQTSMSEVPFHIVEGGQWPSASLRPRQFKQRHRHGPCCCAGKQGTPTK